MSLPVKIVVPPSIQKNCPGGKPKRTPSDKHRKKLNAFYTCILWSEGTGSLRTAAMLSSISCSHYDFLHKPIKNSLFNAPITDRTVYFSSTVKHVSSFL